ncbi:MAG: hypothetical protein WCC81_01810 [Pseudolabrys sp.]
MDRSVGSLCRGNSKPVRSIVANGKLVLSQNTVTAENINPLFEQAGVTGEIDLLSIDIDYNDYWIWKPITAVSPRVVVIEYNATLRPPMSLVVPYDPACGSVATRSTAWSAATTQAQMPFLCVTMWRAIASLIRRRPRSTTSRRAISTRCSPPAIVHARDLM